MSDSASANSTLHRPPFITRLECSINHLLTLLALSRGCHDVICHVISVFLLFSSCSPARPPSALTAAAARTRLIRPIRRMEQYRSVIYDEAHNYLLGRWRRGMPRRLQSVEEGTPKMKSNIPIKFECDCGIWHKNVGPAYTYG